MRGCTKRCEPRRRRRAARNRFGHGWHWRLAISPAARAGNRFCVESRAHHPIEEPVRFRFARTVGTRNTATMGKAGRSSASTCFASLRGTTMSSVCADTERPSESNSEKPSSLIRLSRSLHSAVFGRGGVRCAGSPNSSASCCSAGMAPGYRRVAHNTPERSPVLSALPNTARPRGRSP
jgi:hypothetical protein